MRNYYSVKPTIDEVIVRVMDWRVGDFLRMVAEDGACYIPGWALMLPRDVEEFSLEDGETVLLVTPGDPCSTPVKVNPLAQALLGVPHFH